MRIASDARIVDWGVSDLKPATESRPRLFCFPCAGGAAAMYRPWRQRVPSGVTLSCVELPGRPAVAPDEDAWRPLLDSLVDRFPDPREPFWFFGHSLGGLVAFELARALRRRGLSEPQELFVSGSRPPQSKSAGGRLLHRLSDPDLVQELRDMGGTPPQALDEPELLDLLLPVVRYDFRLLETHRYTLESPLACPISVLAGEKDTLVAPEVLGDWRYQTSSRFDFDLYPGGHFFQQSATGAEFVLRTVMGRVTASRL